MMQGSAALTPHPTALIGGVEVAVIPSTATADDVVLGGGTIAGTETVLRVLTSDAPPMKNGTPVVWAGSSWTVRHIALVGGGPVKRVFLREALP